MRHGGSGWRSSSLRAWRLSSSHSLQSLGGLALGVLYSPASHMLALEGLCSFSWGPDAWLWELVWGACEENKLLRGGLEEWPLGWASVGRDRASGGLDVDMGAGVGRWGVGPGS